MADNPKLIIELQDRGGAQGASPNPNQPGSYPKDSATEDFQRKITEEGAGKVQQPTPAPTPVDPVSTALDNQARQSSSIPIPSDILRRGAPDTQAGVVAKLLAEQPDIQPKELAQFLQVSKSEADELIRQAKANQRENLPSPTPLPSEPLGMPPRASRSTSTASEVDPATGIPYPSQTLPTPSYGPLGNALPPTPNNPGPVIPTRPQDTPSSPVTPATSDTRSYMIDRTSDDLLPSHFQYGKDVAVDAEVIEEQTNKKQEVSGKQAAAAVTKLSHLIGIPQEVAGPAASVLASLPEAGAIGGSLVALATNPVTIGAAATLAVGAAGYYALDNEANRAVALSSQYSPEAVRAIALAEVRQVFANLKSASRLGDEAADYVESKSKISTDLQNIRDILSEPILQKFNKSVDAFSRVTNAVSNYTEKHETAIQTILKTYIDPFNFMGRDKPKEKEFNLHDWFDQQVPIPALPAPFVEVKDQQVAGDLQAPAFKF